MSDNFNNKDYGEYFSAIEKSLNSGKIPTNETTVKPIHKKKKCVVEFLDFAHGF